MNFVKFCITTGLSFVFSFVVSQQLNCIGGHQNIINYSDQVIHFKVKYVGQTKYTCRPDQSHIDRDVEGKPVKHDWNSPNTICCVDYIELHTAKGNNPDKWFKLSDGRDARINVSNVSHTKLKEAGTAISAAGTVLAASQGHTTTALVGAYGTQQMANQPTPGETAPVVECSANGNWIFRGKNGSYSLSGPSNFRWDGITIGK